MRTSYRHLALVVPLVIVLFLVALPASGQFKVNRFDTAVADTQFNVVFNVTANNTEPKPFHIISDDPAMKREGVAALKNEWRVHTTEDWGGMNMLSFTLPGLNRHDHYSDLYRLWHGDTSYINWDGGTHLSLWYNNTNPSTASGNGVQMRFHIYEAGPGLDYYTDSTKYEDWYFQSAEPVNNTTPGWHELIIPLVDTGTRNSPSANGFCITDWSGAHGNDQLDLDKIIGYTIEWTAGKVANDTAGGIVFYDDLRLQGLGQKAGYESFYSFADFTKDTTDFNAGWSVGGTSYLNPYNEQVDTLMGASVLGWDWKVNAYQSWGGGINREYNLPSGSYMADLSSRAALQFYMKVVEPLACSLGSIQNKVTLRFVLFDYSNGAKEEWYTVVPVKLDSVGVAMGWQQVDLPLNWIQSNNWGDLKVGQFNTPNGAQDNILAFDKIGGFKLEFSVSADAGEPTGANVEYSGKILFSNIVPTGYKETDHTPPEKVTNLQATGLSYSNVLTWVDPPDETGSTYIAYVSDNPFTSAGDPGVENIPNINGLSMPYGTQIATHPLRYPKVDHSVSLYYGVTATDKAGNMNEPAVIGPVTNTAKGVPTIAMATINNFVADGDLSEWGAATPFLLTAFGSTPTAHVSTNTTISSDADLSATAYLAADAIYLYVAFDVTDDVVSIDTSATASTWLQDAPDLFIGLYDWRGKHHGAISRGAAPDYHFRCCLNKLISDNPGVTVLTPGPDYAFVEKQLTPGYIVEARIPWARIKEVIPADTLFVPVEGMRIPIDFEINDNDTPGDNTAREGMLCYSTITNDQSYSDVWRWTYTWLGDKATVGVADRPTVAEVYALQQNYPNPFNPSTIIKYSLAKSGPVTVRVYDLIGREVATLVNGEVQSAGEHQVTFSSGSLRSGLSSGVYFYRIESGSFRDVKKMMLVK
jgi:hypothetical protein